MSKKKKANRPTTLYDKCIRHFKSKEIKNAVDRTHKFSKIPEGTVKGIIAQSMNATLNYLGREKMSL